MALSTVVQQLLNRLGTRLSEAEAEEALLTLCEELEAEPAMSKQVLRGNGVHNIVQAAHQHAQHQGLAQQASKLLQLVVADEEVASHTELPSLVQLMREVLLAHSQHALILGSALHVLHRLLTLQPEQAVHRVEVNTTNILIRMLDGRNEADTLRKFADVLSGLMTPGGVRSGPMVVTFGVDPTFVQRLVFQLGGVSVLGLALRSSATAPRAQEALINALNSLMADQPDVVDRAWELQVDAAVPQAMAAHLPDGAVQEAGCKALYGLTRVDDLGERITRTHVMVWFPLVQRAMNTFGSARSSIYRVGIHTLTALSESSPHLLQMRKDAEGHLCFRIA